MQDRYIGDIGDFRKLALLRASRPGHRLGVAWWRHPDETHNRDGRHVDYLHRPSEWRALDPELLDGLARIVAAGERRISALQDAGFLADTVFSDDVIPIGTNPAQRRADRLAWFARTQAALAGCDLVFLDPDNGLETSSFSLGAITAGKCVSLT